MVERNRGLAQPERGTCGLGHGAGRGQAAWGLVVLIAVDALVQATPINNQVSPFSLFLEKYSVVLQAVELELELLRGGGSVVSNGCIKQMCRAGRRVLQCAG